MQLAFAEVPPVIAVKAWERPALHAGSVMVSFFSVYFSIFLAHRLTRKLNIVMHQTCERVTVLEGKQKES